MMDECADCPMYLHHAERYSDTSTFFCEYCYVVPYHDRYPAKECRC